MKNKIIKDNLELRLISSKEYINRFPNQEILEYEIRTGAEIGELIKQLKEDNNIIEKNGDYVKFEPAKIIICKNSK